AEEAKLGIRRVQRPSPQQSVRKAHPLKSATPTQTERRTSWQAANGLAKAQMKKIRAQKTHEKSLGPATTVRSGDKEWMSKANRSKQPKARPATADIASRRVRKIARVASRVVQGRPLGMRG